MKKFQNDKNGGHDTGGSCTIIYQWDLLRLAGATARQMLIDAAARTWNVAPALCDAANHKITNKQTGQSLDFLELASRPSQSPVPRKCIAEKDKDFQLIGKPKAAKLIPSMVTGNLKYGIDVHLPAMLYAVVARCPVFKGKLKSFDAAKNMAGKRRKESIDDVAYCRSANPNALYAARYTRRCCGSCRFVFYNAKKGKDALVMSCIGGPNAHYSTEDFEALAAQRALHRTDPTGFIGDENAVSNLAHVRKHSALPMCFRTSSTPVWSRSTVQPIRPAQVARSGWDRRPPT